MDKRELVDYKGNPTIVSCLGCALENGEIEKTGSVLTTAHFDAHQDFEIPIPGFIVLASKRHFQSVDEFTEEEKIDFIDSIIRIRSGMRRTLGIDVVYFVQEEDTSHHFHMWIFPRYDWMAEKFGRKISSLRPIMEYARENLKTEENLKKVEESITQLVTYFASK